VCEPIKCAGFYWCLFCYYSPFSLAIDPTAANGLKALSVVRFDKLATLENQVIAGKIGDADAVFLKAAAPVFFGVFGFQV
jgi:hypothetical protein